MAARYTPIDWIVTIPHINVDPCKGAFFVRDLPINKWLSFSHLWKSNYRKVDLAGLLPER
jgi:hypothetical protein